MVIPPLILVRLQRGFLKNKSMGFQTMVNLGLIATTMFSALPFALAIFPQKQAIQLKAWKMICMVKRIRTEKKLKLFTLTEVYNGLNTCNL